MANEDGAGSIMWPDSLADLGVLENLLKCGICYEFMNTALITPCSHNFCSVCIRKFMQYRTLCPQCLTMVNEIELKNNRALDELIVVMLRLRGPLSQTLKGVKQDSTKSQRDASPSKSISTNPSIQDTFDAPRAECEIFPSPQKLNNTSFEASPSKTPHNSSGLLQSPLGPGSPSQSQSRQEKIKVRSLISMMKNPLPLTLAKSASLNGTASKVPMVICPVCQVEIPEANINMHMDRCLESNNKVHVAAIKTPEKKPDPSRRKLPKLVYDLMKEADLRKKCGETKLSTQGDKKTLVKRHKRYILLYNSECDSINPRPVSEVIKQVEREEREEAKANSKVFKALQIDRKAQPEVIASAQSKYRSEHKDHFEKLKADLRVRQRSKENPSASTSSSSASSTVPNTTSASCAVSDVKIPDTPVQPEEDSEKSAESPGTPNSEMDLLLTQQSPVIKKMTNPVVQVVLSDDEDSLLESMFSQPIASSSSSKKKRKKRVARQTESDDEDDDDDMWSSDVIKVKPNQMGSQTESLPLRRSCRKRSKNGSENCK